jgi:alpha-beta hydrolase superfamily lysophospholipase
VWPPKVDWSGTAAWLDAIVQRVRDDARIDGDRVAIWAFSGGGMLTGSWLAHSPSWLRCVALTYPVLAVIIEKTYPLTEAAAAVTHMLSHRARGKVAITTEPT